jgi:hypothetical protein
VQHEAVGFDSSQGQGRQEGNLDSENGYQLVGGFPDYLGRAIEYPGTPSAEMFGSAEDSPRPGHTQEAGAQPSGDERRVVFHGRCPEGRLVVNMEGGGWHLPVLHVEGRLEDGVPWAAAGV